MCVCVCVCVRSLMSVPLLVCVSVCQGAAGVKGWDMVGMRGFRSGPFFPQRNAQSPLMGTPCPGATYGDNTVNLMHVLVDSLTPVLVLPKLW